MAILGGSRFGYYYLPGMGAGDFVAPVEPEKDKLQWDGDDLDWGGDNLVW